MVTTKKKTAKAKTWKSLYKQQVIDRGCEHDHNGSHIDPPCIDIFPMDCPTSYKELGKALQQWGKCWETWGEDTYDELQGSLHCGNCNPQLVLPPNPICAICEAMKGLHAQWTLWAERVNDLLKACSSSPTHIPPPPPPFN